MWLRKLPIIPTLITLVCVVIMFGLGIWQLDRKAEKDVRLAQIEERRTSEAYTLSELMLIAGEESTTSQTEDIQDYPVQVIGEANIDKLFYIDNKINEGRVGFEVVVPIKLNSDLSSQISKGASSDPTFVLANLGWLRGSGIRGELPNIPQADLALIAGTNNVFRGVVKYPSNNAMVSETNISFGEFPALLQQLDLAKAAEHLQLSGDKSLLPFIINIDKNPQTEFVREWQPVVMAPEKHLGYAAQWFGLGIAALTIYLLSLMKLLHSKNNKET
ncbi:MULTISPECIES: SURF1 family protein [Alteromonadaceae]|uniref:SURF1-like protein n=1 Tax=Brumicola blandensis TaxID=3075611 RepID=A0AAW8R352_9ALTE|nr:MULTISPECIES: SURF1 family protein [unclassified Alteromonas]MDT0583721.1 SURF1 family protein [Alteromonas sp. W409]MDT0629154.1 SURF1 family protein [Alteromonas sp. W364]